MTGPILQALRDGYTQRTINEKGEVVKEIPIELNVFRNDCSSCKAMAYITCMHTVSRTNQISDKDTKRQLANAILTNYRLLEHFVVRNQICDGKYMTRTIRNDVAEYAATKNA